MTIIICNDGGLSIDICERTNFLFCDLILRLVCTEAAEQCRVIGSVGQRAQDTLDTGAGNNIKQFTFPTLCLEVFYINTIRQIDI